MKRKWLHELPYLLIALYATKIGQAWRLAEGKDAAHKLLSLMDKVSGNDEMMDKIQAWVAMLNKSGK